MKGIGGLVIRRTSGDNPNFCIIKNGQNTEKSPGDDNHYTTGTQIFRIVKFEADNICGNGFDQRKIVFDISRVFVCESKKTPWVGKIKRYVTFITGHWQERNN